MPRPREVLGHRYQAPNLTPSLKHSCLSSHKTEKTHITNTLQNHITITITTKRNKHYCEIVLLVAVSRVSAKGQR